jgi:hypothetical protein
MRGKEQAPATSDAADVAAFLSAARVTAPGANGRRGRLVFALDATMSRQPTWDRATVLQAEMFSEAARAGGLDVQLVYFRGLGECRSSRFVADPSALGGLMERISCRGGHTQIGKVLSHALATTREARIDALVYVGDAMEEPLDDLAAKAGQLGLLGVKTFLFQEGRDPVAETAFREIARLTNGAYARFDAASAGTLAMLLRAVAAYAAGGRAALERLGTREEPARLLLSQMGAR